MIKYCNTNYYRAPCCYCDTYISQTIIVRCKIPPLVMLAFPHYKLVQSPLQKLLISSLHALDVWRSRD